MRKLEEVLKDWEAVIGLEVHTELTTLETKMFCGCKLSHDDEPNTNVCPVCLGLPGALPVPNEQAIRSIVKAGLATNCTIEKRSMFYRKHYFYPDMAKNFQTTQGPVAFCMHGHLDLAVAGEGAKERPDDSVNVEKAADGSYVAPIRILRIHMEEDAAKMVHVGGDEGRIADATESLIDYNRCGTPLIELVTEPDLRTPEEARLFMEKLRDIFLTLGISDCSLENGSMRCDGNVSLRRRGEKTLGTKTELKNINSWKNLHDALAYEICRQADVLESGGTVAQETRHWEPSHKRTIVMRVKETADDYRLFPDPDLAPFDLSDEFIQSCRDELPELPDAKRERYVAELGIKVADAAQIADEPDTAAFFEKCVELAKPALVARIASVMVNDVAGYLNGAGETFGTTSITPAQVVSLAGLLDSDAISAKQGRGVVEAMAEEGKDPEAIVDEKGMRQVTDDGALKPIVDQVIAACPDQVLQFKDGNTRVVGFLVGQCMKRAAGAGNPKRFNELLVEAMTTAAVEESAPETPAAAAVAEKVAEDKAAKVEKKPAAKKTPAKKTAAKAAPKKAEPKAAAPKAEKPAVKKAETTAKPAVAAKAPAEKKTAEAAKPATKAAPKATAEAAAPKAAAPKAEAPKKAEPKAAAPKASAAKKPAAKKATTATASKDKAAEKPATTKVTTSKATAPKAAAPKAEPKPAATKAVESKATTATKPAAEKPAAKPAAKAATTKAASAKSTAAKKVESKTAGKATASKAATATKPATKKAPATKTTAAKSTTTKAASTKKAAPKSTTSKAATAKKSTGTKVPAKKSTASKSAPKKDGTK